MHSIFSLKFSYGFILILAFSGMLGSQALAQMTNLPLPRMVSVKAEGVNVRSGPGMTYSIKWVLMQKDFPVEVIAENESWRKIRDWEGAEGWIFHSALSSSRSLIIRAPETVMRRLPDDQSPAIARLVTGIIGRIDRCEPVWCYVAVEHYEGWVKRADSWGLSLDEVLN